MALRSLLACACLAGVSGFMVQNRIIRRKDTSIQMSLWNKGQQPIKTHVCICCIFTVLLYLLSLSRKYSARSNSKTPSGKCQCLGLALFAPVLRWIIFSVSFPKDRQDPVKREEQNVILVV